MSTTESLAPSPFSEVRYIERSFKTLAALVTFSNVEIEWDLIQVVVDVGGVFKFVGIFKKNDITDSRQ